MATHKQVIEGYEYTTDTLPASEGLIILPKLIATLGEEVANLLFATTDDQQAALFENPKVIAAMLVKISERASANDGLLVLKDIMKNTRVDRTKVGDAEIPSSVYDRFDTHFAGRYAHLFKVFGWVARMNFAPP